MSKISILIAEDHAVVRAGVAALLETEDDLSVVALARNGEEAIREAKRLRPRIVLSDLVMPKASGVAVAEALSRELPDTRVIILTSFSASEGIAHALHAGAAGALMKTDDVLSKIGAANRTEAVAIAIQKQLLKI